MGINPGESKTETENNWPRGGPFEESALEDFRARMPPNAATVRWRRYLEDLLGSRPRVETEQFFFSTERVGDIETRYGATKRLPEYLRRCDELNARLIHIMAPRLVLVVGRSLATRLKEPFGLTLGIEVTHDGRPIALQAVSVRMFCPWLFVSHPQDRGKGKGSIKARTDALRVLIDQLIGPE